jgi:hypothetical protein
MTLKRPGERCDTLLTLDQVAHRLNLSATDSERAVKRLLAKAETPYRRLGG